MKKILCTLFPIVTIFSLFIFPNILLAQQQEAKGVVTEGDCLKGMGKDCFKYEEIIGIKNYQKGDYNALSIVQDVLLAATYMVGTVLTIVIIRCGLGYIIAASKDGKGVEKYKNGLVYGVIGAVLVMGAYAIVRLIQYVARG